MMKKRSFAFSLAGAFAGRLAGSFANSPAACLARVPRLLLLAVLCVCLTLCPTFAAAEAAQTGEGDQTGTAAETASAAPETTLTVHTVDELLDAIGPDRTIRLEPGVYNLTEASSYGSAEGTAYWQWVYTYDGYQLSVSNVSGLRLEGAGVSLTSIVTEPRYANVLHFEACSDLHIADLTAGHTPDEGYCSGGVLDFTGCRDIAVSGCDLYGCGTYGITADSCSSLIATGTTIHHCTYGAVEAVGCLDFRFLDGRIEDCGKSKSSDNEWCAFDLLHAVQCTGFAVLNTVIEDNVAQTVFSSSNSADFLIAGCAVRDNAVGLRTQYPDGNGYLVTYAWGGMFNVVGQAARVIGTSFEYNSLSVPFFGSDEQGLSSVTQVVDEAGRPLDQARLEGMTRVEYDESLYSFSGSGTDLSGLSGETSPAGYTIYHVHSADEFLAALGSRTCIYVDCDVLDFSAASNYGGPGGEFYYWDEMYDGPSLVITGVEDLRIIGQGSDSTLLQVTPRYADVLHFEACRDILLENLTAGHKPQEPGECTGDVFEFAYCSDVIVRNCSLFGCGLIGLNASDCTCFIVDNTEMYDCSEYGAVLMGCDHFIFSGCRVHDCSMNGLLTDNSNHILWNKQHLNNGFYEDLQSAA